MKEYLLGEIWESFFVEGHKVGFLHRNTVEEAESNLLTTTLSIAYGKARFQHIYSFWNKSGYPSHSYLLDSDNGAPVHVRFRADKMMSQIDEEVFVEKVPAGTRPSYGIYPLLVSTLFLDDHRQSFPYLDDASCSLRGTTELVSLGWESVTIAEEQMQLWAIREYNNGQPGNRYWLDEDRRIRLSNWRGAISYWVGSKDEALEGLPPHLIEHANSLAQTVVGDDWTADIEAWLNQDSE